MKSDYEIDDELRAALRAEDAELLARIEQDPGIRDVLREGFRGRMAWWMFLVSGVQLAMFVLAVWAAIGFFGAATVDDRVFWCVCMLVAWTGVAMLKMMVWSHVENHVLLREVKRVELQVATLSLRLQQRDGG
jgi:hypothetical protein